MCTSFLWEEYVVSETHTDMCRSGLVCCASDSRIIGQSNEMKFAWMVVHALKVSRRVFIKTGRRCSSSTLTFSYLYSQTGNLERQIIHGLWSSFEIATLSFSSHICHNYIIRNHKYSRYSLFLFNFSMMPLNFVNLPHMFPNYHMRIGFNCIINHARMNEIDGDGIHTTIFLVTTSLLSNIILCLAFFFTAGNRGSEGGQDGQAVQWYENYQHRYLLAWNVVLWLHNFASFFCFFWCMKCYSSHAYSLPYDTSMPLCEV